MHYYRDPAKFTSLLLAGAISLISTQALASGFLLHEQSATLMGGFYAGSAAIAEDASTNWYNPAGLTRVEGANFVASGINVSPQTEFKGTTGVLVTGVPSYYETGEATGGTARLVPAMHGSWKFNKQWAVGLSVVTPFGLSTNYAEDSIARYNATESELKTIDISPSIAYQPLDWLSFGLGADAEYAEAKLDAVLGSPQTCLYTPPGAAPTCLDSLSKNKANDWGWGWHAGVLAVSKNTGTQVGLAFHSNIEQSLSGRSKLHGPLNPLGYESEVYGDIDLPWWIVGSITQRFSKNIMLLGSIEYTHWSSIQSLVMHDVQSTSGTTATSTDELNYEDTWGFFGGARWNALPTVMLSVGGGYEQTPTNDTDRDLRLPDANRWLASCGLRWMPEAAKNVSLDVAYAHIWGQEVDVNKVLHQGSQTITAVGEDNSQVNLLGASITVKI